MDLSIVIPVFNESGSISLLMEELKSSLQETGRTSEIIWVDDGSTDTTESELSKLATSFENVRILRRLQRGGQSAALWAGLQAANGSVLITLDGDRQNDPADIGKLLAKLDQFDFVVGWRVDRCDIFSKRVFSWIANLIRQTLTRSNLRDSGCSLRAFRRECLDIFVPFNGMHRFLPTMAELANLRVCSLEVQHRPRSHGVSKYGILNRCVGPLVDCLVVIWLARKRLNWRDFQELTPRGE